MNLFVCGRFHIEHEKELLELMKKHPKLKGEKEEYEMTREEMIENYWKKIKLINEL